MKSFVNLCKFALFSLALALLLTSGNYLREGISSGLNLSISVVIPSLFTFIVFSTFIVNTSFFGMLKSSIPAFIPRLFKMNKSEFLSFIISLIGGYPSGAKMLAEMHASGEITENRAAALLPFFISAGPAFIITGIGLSFYNSSLIGFIIFSSHTISSFILPIFALKKGERDRKISSNTSGGIDRFVASVNSCSAAVITMTGFIIFFSALLNTAKHLLNIEIEIFPIFAIFLEITNGCQLISQNFPINSALITISAGLSFSSISILMQAKFLCGNLSINIIKLIFIRVVHAIISSFICFFLLQITAIPSEVFSNIGKTTNSITSLSAVSALMFLLLMLTTIIKVEKNTGKSRRNLLK